jgi:hypothetical protein
MWVKGANLYRVYNYHNNAYSYKRSEILTGLVEMRIGLVMDGNESG